MPKITDYHNLMEAARKASRGKRDRSAVRRYFDEIDDRISELRCYLLKGDEPPWEEYSYFTIADPKERLISAAPFAARVLHHALINVCGPILERGLTDYTFACRRGMGQYAAIEQARRLHSRSTWCVKLDVRKYFDSIPHAPLKEMLRRHFRERRLLTLLYQIIDSYETTPGCGLPIGNLTSQYFANLYLSPIDHAVFETIGASGYVRYMDDMLLYANDREAARRAAFAVRDLLTGRGLSLKVMQLRRTDQTTEFLGYRLKGHSLLLSARSMKRYRRKLRLFASLYETGSWSEAEYIAHLDPLTAFVLKSDDIAFRRKALQL